MRFFARNFSIIFLALLTITATGGITISKMVCNGSGKQSWFLGKSHDCCKSENKHGDQLKGDCCDVKSADIKVSQYQSTRETNAPDEDVQTDRFPVLSFFLRFFDAPSSTGSGGKSPPSLSISGYSLLKFISVFRL
jgi:hypothetical protein